MPSSPSAAHFSPDDHAFMTRALALARLGLYSTHPNPRVGCVIVRGGQIVGEGFHLKAGEPHAEIMALAQARAWAEGATAYVTLEPCSHFGRTPPCIEALITAKVQRVVCAMQDPNPLVAGKGIQKLSEAGIQVDIGLLEDEARELNLGFISRFTRRRPWVRLKIAMSLDGKTALSDGRSQWITSEAARADVQHLRAQSAAILTGIGTVLADNPRLTVRDFEVLRPPVRMVLDSRLRLPTDSHLWQDDSAPTWIFHCQTDPYATLKATVPPHVRLFDCSTDDRDDAATQLDLAQALTTATEEGINDILIECGATLSAAFLRAGLVDELIVYQAPKILGGLSLSPFCENEYPEALSTPPHWTTTDVVRLDNDIRWRLRALN